MQTKYKVIIAVSTIILAFAVGRYSVPQKIKVVTKTVEVEKKTDATKTDEKKNVVVVVHEIRRPNGTIDKTTTTTVSDQRNSTHTSTDNKLDASTTDKEITAQSSKITISLLGGDNVGSGTISPPVFGVSITRPILGPITVGVWGLNNATFGASIGLTF